MSLVLFVSVVATAGSCASAPNQPTTPRAARSAGTWSKLSWEDRHEVMTFAVLPNIARTWQAHDATPYPVTTCARCHGANAEAVDYKMPGPIPALDPARMPSAASSDPREAKMTKFMTDEIVPQMIDLLDADPYDAKTGRGLSCFTCHPSVKR